jgi:hypothetical protein
VTRSRGVGAWLVFAIAVAGCSAVPNLDRGSAGCNNAGGNGPADGPVPFASEVTGKTPAEAASIAAGRGQNVVFRVNLPDFGECWCKPPPNGRVTEAWWNGHGALYLMVDGVDAGHDADHQPFFGWGC